MTKSKMNRAAWILGRWRRMPEGVAYCRDHRGVRWEEWERRLLKLIRRNPVQRSTLVAAGVLYAREILKGRWLGLENFLFVPENYEHLIAYMQRDIVGTRWKEMEDTVLNGTCHPLLQSSYAVRYAIQVRQGRWRAAESIILSDASDPVLSQLADRWLDYSGVTCPVEYALKVIKGRWWRLEREIVSGRSALLVGVDYAQRIRKASWRGLERRLSTASPSNFTPICLSTYAALVRLKRWPAGEKALLRHPLADHLRDAIIIYAYGAIGRRWRKAEPLLHNSPKHLRVYADKVLKGRLPHHLHNEMMMRSFQFPEDPDIREYIAKYGV